LRSSKKKEKKRRKEVVSGILSIAVCADPNVFASG
jgi:hypothetical protein